MIIGHQNSKIIESIFTFISKTYKAKEFQSTRSNMERKVSKLSVIQARSREKIERECKRYRGSYLYLVMDF